MAQPKPHSPHMTPPDKMQRTGRFPLLAGLLIIPVIALIAWQTLTPDTTQDPETMDARTLDVETQREDAQIPVEDANPNPVVPQNALIPPKPVDDAPPD